MGAWGVGSFENDDALDWAYKLEKAPDFGVVRSALEAVTEGDAHLHAPTCSEAIAAAEVVAAALGRPMKGLPEDVAAWSMEHRDVPPDLVVLARRALRAIESKSELRDLFEDTEYFAAWQETIRDLESRIAGQIEPT